MLRQNVCYLPDNSLIYVFFNEKVWISIKILLELISKGPVNSNAALVQLMGFAPNNKPLSETMMAKFTDSTIHLSASMSYSWCARTTKHWIMIWAHFTTIH